MKKPKFSYFLNPSGFFLTLVLFCLTSLTSYSQGQTKQRESKDENFKYLKTFKVKQGTSINVNTVTSVNEYAYILNKGVKYTITTLNSEKNTSKVIVQLFDRNHKIIATNFDEKTKKYYSALNYLCSATGIYYMAFICEDKNAECGEGILKFRN